MKTKNKIKHYLIMLSLTPLLLAGCNICGNSKCNLPPEKFTNADSVSASSFESKAHGGWGDFPPALTIDGDLTANSSWRAETANKANPQWIQYDLGGVRTVSKISIAFVKGDTRKYFLRIAVSNDGNKWFDVFDGESSGTTNELEVFNILSPKARFVRIYGLGNTNEKFGNWINITETEIWSF